jgi:hypothetical protein
MSDRQLPPDMDQLEQALRTLSLRVEYPPTPNLAPHVRARLEQAPRRAAGPRAFIERRLATTTLLVALFALLAVALVPPARTAVARLFGIPGIVVTRGTLPPGPLGKHLLLGKRVTLDDARSLVDFPILVPSLPSLGQPDEVYVGSVPGSKSVTLLYRARPGLPRSNPSGAGLLLTEFRVLPASFPIEKLVGPETRYQDVQVHGTLAYWIGGPPHFLLYRAMNGRIYDDYARLAGHVLVWTRHGISYRLEADLGPVQMVRIAESAR